MLFTEANTEKETQRPRSNKSVYLQRKIINISYFNIPQVITKQADYIQKVLAHQAGHVNGTNIKRRIKQNIPKPIKMFYSYLSYFIKKLNL